MRLLPVPFFSRRMPFAFMLALCALLPCALTGCASINEAQKTAQVGATLDEADRQFSLGHDKAALTWCDRAIALLPHSPIPYIGDQSENPTDQPTLISVLTSRGRYPELAAYLTKAAADPKIGGNWQILQALGDAQSHIGQASASRETYAKMLVALTTSMKTPGASINPGLRLTKADAEWNAGNQTDAEKDYQTIIDTQKENAAVAENNLAFGMAVAKVDLPKALVLAQKAVADARASDDSEEIGIYLDTLGWVEHQMGNDSQAVSHLQEAVSLVPGVPDVHFHLAEIYRATGHRDEAAIEYRQAVTLDSSDKDAQAGLAAVASRA